MPPTRSPMKWDAADVDLLRVMVTLYKPGPQEREALLKALLDKGYHVTMEALVYVPFSDSLGFIP
jgi:hypothetical protein